MDIIKKQRAEAAEGKSLKVSIRTAYQKAYEEEKKAYEEEKEEIRKERERLRLARAEMKAKRDVRNPLYRRLAKKFGAKTKEGIAMIAAEAGKQVAKKKAEHDALMKARGHARRSELIKIASEQERMKVRQQFNRQQAAPRDLLGVGKHRDIIGQSPKIDLLGSTPKVNVGRTNFIDVKRKKKDDGFGGFI